MLGDGSGEMELAQIAEIENFAIGFDGLAFVDVNFHDGAVARGAEFDARWWVADLAAFEFDEEIALFDEGAELGENFRDAAGGAAAEDGVAFGDFGERADDEE